MRSMTRLHLGLAILVAIAPAAISGQQPARGRPLAIEDYYRLQTVGSPAISPSGRWVVFTVSTRIEDDNTTRTDTFVVPADASARPLRVAHYGKEIANASWTADSRLEYAAERERWSLDPQNPSAPPHKAAALPAGAAASPDTKWIAFARDKAQTKAERAYASEFEKRHEERFKGVAFDWKDFQRDGAPFPAPNLRARPAAQLVVRSFDSAQGRPGAAGAEKVLVDADHADQPHGISGHWNNVHRAMNELAWWNQYLKGAAVTRTSSQQ
jgi:dipeptidyl aminopeptidase/acylaminoacyl peptidase